MVRKLVRFAFVLLVIFLLNDRVLEAEEIPKFYQVICQDPNGNNGYYRTTPQVTIKHFDERLVTRYQIRLSSGRKITGKIAEAGKSVVIPATVFEEGEHQLDAWMEETNGNVVAGTEQTRKIKIDCTGPENAIQFTINKEKENVVEIEAEDAVSGVEGVYYKLENGEVQYLKGAHVYVTVPKEFQGKITAYAVDKAGNIGTTWESGKIDGSNMDSASSENIKLQISKSAVKGESVSGEQSAASVEQDGVLKGNTDASGKNIDGLSGDTSENLTKPVIVMEGIENYMIVGSDVQFSCKVTNCDEVRTLEGEIVWEDVNGSKKTMEVTEWSREGDTYIFLSELKEDGIYYISFQVINQEGEQSEEKRQIIIDKTNPVIKRVQELNGAKLGSFQWDYDADEIVTDFTTYTYEVRLDGILCDEKKVYSKAGKHKLEVFVTDAAGNQTKAEAEFWIIAGKGRKVLSVWKVFLAILVSFIVGRGVRILLKKTL